MLLKIKKKSNNSNNNNNKKQQVANSDCYEKNHHFSRILRLTWYISVEKTSRSETVRFRGIWDIISSQTLVEQNVGIDSFEWMTFFLSVKYGRKNKKAKVSYSIRY